MKKKQIVVIGGGLAGCTAAWQLAKAGAAVHLIEAEKMLGGRLATRSHVHVPYHGKEYRFALEHGLHGLWRNYRNVHQMLEQLELSSALVPVASQNFYWRNGDNTVNAIEIGARLRNSRFPALAACAELALNKAFAVDFLQAGLHTNRRMIQDVLRIITTDLDHHLAALDHQTVDALIAHWPPAIRQLFCSLTHAGFFEEPSRVSAAAFILGLLYYVTEDKNNSAFSVLAGDTESALFRPLRGQLRELGVRMYLNETCLTLKINQEKVSHVKTSERVLDSDAVVVALDAPACRQLFKASAFDMEDMNIPQAVPSIVVRLWFNRDVAAAPTAVTAGLNFSALFWLHQLQTQFANWHTQTGGGVLECHLYGDLATRAMAKSPKHIVTQVLHSVEEIWPSLSGACVHSHCLVNPATHTAFHPATLTNAPNYATPIANVALCGDWVQTPWPSLYLERACSTGVIAARYMARLLGLSTEEMMVPVPPYAPARSVGLAKILRRFLSA